MIKFASYHILHWAIKPKYEGQGYKQLSSSRNILIVIYGDAQRVLDIAFHHEDEDLLFQICVHSLFTLHAAKIEYK